MFREAEGRRERLISRQIYLIINGYISGGKMQIEISDEHIENLAKINNLKINNLDKLKKFIKFKVNDEAQENGATYLCVFIEQLLRLAYEDDAGLELIEI